MSFGWSAGDIVSTISILVKVGNALKESGGAASEYQATVDFLNSVKKTLIGLQAVLQSNPDLKWESELIEQGELLKSACENFKKKIDKYDLSLGVDTERKKARRVPREVQFALSSQVKELRAVITQPQIVLGVFLNLQNLSTILELCKNTALLQDGLKQLTKNISQELPDISKSVSALRQDLLSGIRETNSLERDMEKKVQNTLADVKVHMEEAKDLQKSLAEKSDASSADLRRWQNELRFSCQALYDCSKTQLELLLKYGAKIDALPKPELPATNWLQIVISTVQIISTVVSGLGTISSLASQPAIAKSGNFPHTTLPYRLLNSSEISPQQLSDENWNKACRKTTESFNTNDRKLFSDQLRSIIDGRTPIGKAQPLPPDADNEWADFYTNGTYIPLGSDTGPEAQPRRSTPSHSDISYSMRRFLDDPSAKPIIEPTARTGLSAQRFDTLWQSLERTRLRRSSSGDRGSAVAWGFFTCNFEACFLKHIEFSRFADLKRHYKSVHEWEGLEGAATIFMPEAARNLLPKEKELKAKAKDGVILHPRYCVIKPLLRNSFFTPGRVFQEQSYHLSSFFDPNDAREPLKSEGYPVGFVVMSLKNDEKTCECLIIRDYVGSRLELRQQWRDRCVIYTNDECKEEATRVKYEEVTAFPPMKVRREREDEYKDLGPNCRALCSPVYVIETDRPVLNIGHVDGSDLATLARWYNNELGHIKRPVNDMNRPLPYSEEEETQNLRLGRKLLEGWWTCCYCQCQVNGRLNQMACPECCYDRCEWCRPVFVAGDPDGI